MPSLTSNQAILSLTLGLVLTALVAVPTAADSKKPVTSVSDLPTLTYEIPSAASDLLDDEDAFVTLVNAVDSDVRATLDEYEIQDSATLQRYYGILMNIAMLERRFDEALDWLAKSRELETKEAQRLTQGLVAEAFVEASAQHEEGTDAFAEAFSTSYGNAVRALPWDTVQDALQSTKGRLEMISPQLLRGMVVGTMDPIVANAGELNLELAAQIIGMRWYLEHLAPLQQHQLAVIEEVVAANKVAKTDIWPDRVVELDPTDDLEPVVVGIWDSGVDPHVFGEQMYVNPSEQRNGIDDDGNGFIDDLHGIAFDVFGNPHPELLHPHGDQTGKVAEAIRYVKGLMDLQAAIDSEEASELKKKLSTMKPEQVSGFMTALGFNGLYTHGTHVAGIAAAGNPFARILAARITFDYHVTPVPITENVARRHAASYARAAAYFRTHDVRVVNMSWGWTFAEIEASLEANGIGADADERKAMTEKIFGTLSDGLYGALASCPKILFVCAAGNDDADVEFGRSIPSSFGDLDNLLVVGAVDQAGERTSFTSMGSNVVVYANGFEVVSSIPGGETMAMSGTSMASPNVTNLAAKILAVNPDLGPAEVIEIIEANADQLADQPSLKLIHPRATIDAVRSADNG